MALEKPAWLDALYVQKILQNAEKDESIEVSGIIVNPATAKGDNYASDMYRTVVEFSRVQDGHQIQEKKSLMVKVIPYGRLSQDMMDALPRLFATEMSMMSVILPQMRKILESVNSASLGASCFYVQYEEPVHVVFEDLMPKGFRMADRRVRLDLDHCLLALRNLGRFHAASIALKEGDPQAYTKYSRGLFHKDQAPAIVKLHNAGAKLLADETTKWPELSPRITEKLYKLSEVMFEKACEAAIYRDDDFNVLNHGDFWINNMLFRYDEKQKPIDHIFVDFQLCHYGSPATDIHCFLATSPTDEVQLNHRELLMREYYGSLTSTMMKLKCKTPVLSFDELQEILKKRAFCEVIMSITGLPFILLEKGEEFDLDEIFNNDGEYKNAGFHGNTYRKIMTRLLPLYDSMGLLDT